MKSKAELFTASKSLAAAARTASADGASADLRDCDGAIIVFDIGVITDGTHTFEIHESDDDSSWSDVAAADLDGTLTAGTSSADDTVQIVGYKGNSRHIRASVTVAGATTGGVYGASILKTKNRI